MVGNKGYATKCHTKILEYLQKNKERTVTVNDVFSFLEGENIESNISTVYRNLNKLCSAGIVIKRVAEKGQMAEFQYIGDNNHCQEHLHMKCRKCGKVMHLDCEFMDEISNHFLLYHGFQLECTDSILYGVCESCR